MGKRGPKPRIAEDTARKRPAAPRGLDAAEREAWESLCDDLDEAKILRHADRKLIGLYARNHALLERAREALAGAELTLANDSGREFANPLVAVYLQLAARERQYLLDCGLSPTNRKAGSGDGQEDDPYLRLAAGGPL